jgi:hypothetical protein
MMGTENNPGLIRNVGSFLFDFLDRSRARSIEDGFDLRASVTISCIEIYNEQIRDILAPHLERRHSSAGETTNNGRGGGGGGQGGGGASSSSTPSSPAPPPKRKLSSARAASLQPSLKGGVFKKGAKAIGVKTGVEREGNLKIRETANKGVFVEGLRSAQVHTTQEMSAMIDGATGARVMRSTNMNAESSRSHLVFMIELENKAVGNSAGSIGVASSSSSSSSSTTSTLSGLARSTFGKSVTKKAKLNLIDLAGSERSKATGATGEGLKEGANINKVGRCRWWSVVVHQ